MSTTELRNRFARNEDDGQALTNGNGATHSVNGSVVGSSSGSGVALSEGSSPAETEAENEAETEAASAGDEKQPYKHESMTIAGYFFDEDEVTEYRLADEIKPEIDYDDDCYDIITGGSRSDDESDSNSSKEKDSNSSSSSSRSSTDTDSDKEGERQNSTSDIDDQFSFKQAKKIIDDGFMAMWTDRDTLIRITKRTLAIVPGVISSVFHISPILFIVYTMFTLADVIGFVLQMITTTEVVNVLSERIRTGELKSADNLLTWDIFILMAKPLAASVLRAVVSSLFEQLERTIEAKVGEHYERQITKKNVEMDLATMDEVMRRTRSIDFGHEISYIFQLCSSVVGLLSSILRVFSATYLLWRIHSSLVLVAFVQVLLSAISTSFFEAEPLNPLTHYLDDAGCTLSSFITPCLWDTGRTEEVQTNYIGHHILERRNKILDTVKSIDTQLSRRLWIKSALLQIILECQRFPIVLYTAYLVLQGAAQIGEITTLVNTTEYFQSALKQIGEKLKLILRNGVSVKRVMAFLEVKPAITDPENPVPLDVVLSNQQQHQQQQQQQQKLPQSSPAAESIPHSPTVNRFDEDAGITIEFRAVSFAYPNKLNKPILSDLSFVIPAGQTVSLVGRNGAGKSTLVKLLTRMYDPLSGQILFNGVDIRDIKLADVRGLVSVLDQNYTFLPGTAAFAISLGRADAYQSLPHSERLKKVQHAAKKSGFGSILEKKADDGVLTFVSPYGGGYNGVLNMSGGERQKLAIAKAIFRVGPNDIADDSDDPMAGLPAARVVVFDEPASALDAIAESEMHSELHSMIKAPRNAAGKKMVKRSAVFISHRMASSRMADRILVFGEGGRIVEDGSHTDLMKIPVEDSFYRKMFEIQANTFFGELPSAA